MLVSIARHDVICLQSRTQNKTRNLKSGEKKSIVDEITTLRRHLEAAHSVSDCHNICELVALTGINHQGKYRKWADQAKFESKLPVSKEILWRRSSA
jgi:hypothetical protein